MRALRHAALLGVSLWACGRGDTRSELVLVADSDLPLERVVFSLHDEHGRAREAEATTLPASLNVLEKHDPGTLYVTARGYIDGSQVVRREAEVKFVHGETRTVLLHLLARCVDVVCAAHETCGEAGCTPRALAAEDLPPWTGSAPGIEPHRDAAADLDGGSPDASELDGADAADVPTPPLSPMACMELCQLDDDDHAMPMCVDGACAFVCKPGFGDCNLEPDDGCEEDLNKTHEFCGRCDTACADDEKCDRGMCKPD